MPFARFALLPLFPSGGGKILPRDLTSYDFLKTLAVLLMIVDHVGYYFFPEEAWLRVAGRLCVPMWFFLVGYARSRDFGVRMWAGIGILTAANVVTGFGILPLNILATIVFVRIVIDPLMRRAARNDEFLMAAGVIALALSLPLGLVWEYGTLCLPFAMYGWLMRNDSAGVRSLPRMLFMLFFCVGGFALVETVLFDFTALQSAVLSAGLAGVCAGLFFFAPRTFPGMTRVLPAPAAAFFRLFGRRTLEIYVLHLVLFKIMAAAAAGPDRAWFDFVLLG